MTEEEWFGATDLTQLLPTVKREASPRKLRLFMAGVCRCRWARYGMPIVNAVFDCAERYADGAVPRAVVDDTRARIAGGWFWGVPAEQLLCPKGDEFPALERFLAALQTSVWVEKAVLAGLLREVVGNPFGRTDFDPNWLTSTVVLLAKQLYESGEFSAMPILADALQDAGCDSDDVLNHCRDANQFHVRGCWVVDLVLNKA